MSDLHEAADMGSVDQVSVALRRGSEVNMRDESLNGRTPLHLAAANNHTECVRLLLKAGGNPCIKTHSGCTAAHAAAETGALASLTVILESYPEANCADKHGDFPIDFAKTYGHAKVVAYLSKLNDPKPAPAVATKWKQFADVAVHHE